MTLKLRTSRTFCLRAGALFGLAMASAGSVHLAWSKVADPIVVGHGSLPEQTSVTMVLAALQPVGGPGFAPDALIARPLFSSSRRPKAPAEPVPEPVEAMPAAPPEVPPPAYIIDGVIISDNIRKILLRRERREPGQWVSEGEKTREGWTVVSINANATVLKQGVREYSQPLRVGRDSQ